jgi:hypothetical protein
MRDVIGVVDNNDDPKENMRIIQKWLKDNPQHGQKKDVGYWKHELRLSHTLYADPLPKKSRFVTIAEDETDNKSIEQNASLRATEPAGTISKEESGVSTVATEGVAGDGVLAQDESNPLDVASPKKRITNKKQENEDVEKLFARLDAKSSLTRKRAISAVEKHPLSERIMYIQQNFTDILSKLEESGKVSVNCD